MNSPPLIPVGQLMSRVIIIMTTVMKLIMESVTWYVEVKALRSIDLVEQVSHVKSNPLMVNYIRSKKFLDLLVPTQCRRKTKLSLLFM